MECTFNLKLLKQAISFLQKAIPSKPQLPILSSILMEVNENQVTFSATDLFLGIKTTIPAKVKKTGKIAIPGEIFKQIIHSLSSADQLNLKLINNQVLLTASNTKTKLTIQTADDYPAFPEVEGKEFTIETQALKNIKQRVGFAAGLDQTRPILTAIMFEFKQSALRAVATDGFRLSVLDQPYQNNKTDQDEDDSLNTFLLPAKAVDEIVKILEHLDQSSATLVISHELKQVRCQLGNTTMYIRLIEGDYPPYEKIIPSDFAFKTSLDSSSWNEQLKRASLFAKDISSIVKFNFEQDKLKITASSPTLGSYEGEIGILEEIKSGQEIAFNVFYLLEFVQAIESETIVFQMNESLKPAQLSVAEMPSWFYIIMPFRVNK